MLTATKEKISFLKWAVAIENAFFVNLTTVPLFGESLQNRKEKRQRDRSKLHSGERSSADEFLTTILHIRSVSLTLLANKEDYWTNGFIIIRKKDNLTIYAKIKMHFDVLMTPP